MHHKLRKFGFFTVLMLLIAAFSFSQEIEDKIYVPTVRLSSMGGIHAAMTDDLSSIFTNPAGFSSAESELSVAEFTTALKGPIFDIASLVIEVINGGDIVALLATDSTQAMLKNLYAGIDLAGPVYLGYVGDGLGFCCLNTTNITLAGEGAMSIAAYISEAILLTGGYSVGIPIGDDHSIDIGMMFKGSIGGELKFKASVLSLMTLFQNLSPDILMGSNFDFVSKIGLDAGLKYSFRDIFAFGLTAKDIYTPVLRNKYATLTGFLDSTAVPVAVKGLVPFSLNGGILFSPPMGILERFVTDLIILVDYNDILDFLITPGTAANPLLHISLGLELELLEILSLRGGFNQGLFSAGLGMDLTYFTMNVSMYGSELSLEPGRNPVYNMQVGFEFRY